MTKLLWLLHRPDQPRRRWSTRPPPQCQISRLATCQLSPARSRVTVVLLRPFRTPAISWMTETDALAKLTRCIDGSAATALANTAPWRVVCRVTGALLSSFGSPAISWTNAFVPCPLLSAHRSNSSSRAVRRGVCQPSSEASFPDASVARRWLVGTTAFSALPVSRGAP